MIPLKRFRLFRFLESTMLVLGIQWTAGIVFLYTNNGLTQKELVAGVGVWVLIFTVRWFIKKKIDDWFMVYFSQSSYAEEDTFSALFERSPVAYLIINGAGTITESNQAAVRLLQAETTTITEMNFFTCLLDTAEVDLTVLRARVKAGVTLTDIEILMETVKGEKIWVLFSSFMYRNSSQRVVALVNITEQKNVDTAKSEFVALATHQLRTPIAAIRWNVELLQNSLTGVTTESQKNYLTKIERNIIRMIALINDFLSVSKLEMGTYATTKEAVDVGDFFTAIVDEFSGKLTEKQIVLRQSGNPPHAQVSIDPRLLHIIVSNLVSNAVKYLNPRGELQLSYLIQNETVTIHVADNGIGIPEAELDKLFTKFYRASNAQSHQTEGTGLGLYIVQQSVELLGGRISVTSKEDQGAHFTVSLPVQMAVK